MTTLLMALLLGLQDPAGEFRAGFAEEDITPPIGTPRQGGNRENRVERVLDPIFARAAVFERAGEALGFVQLDLAAIPEAEALAIRRRIEARCGVKSERVMVSATHNHAGPAVMNEALPRDEAYVADMVVRASRAFERAYEARRAAQIAEHRSFEWRVAHNRRVVMRDGTVRTHGSFKDPQALRLEGPIDPEVAALAVRATDGVLLGVMVNFACHPTAHWSAPLISAGFPGALARELKSAGYPVCVFLQGSGGNMHSQDPCGSPEKSMEEIGKLLAEDVKAALLKPGWRTPTRLGGRSRRVELAYRALTEDQLNGTARGAQRFGSKGYYDRKIPELADLIRQAGGKTTAEVQILHLDDLVFVGLPAETFVEIGLQIKEAAYPRRAWVAAYANGMLGYIPHAEAFPRGGYEATFGPPSCMAPDVGARLAETALELLR